MATPVDVIIVSYNTRADTLACLASLFETPPGGLARVFVVDNASIDGTAEAVRLAWPAADLIALKRNVGFGAGNNVALRQATAPLVLLLNSDTVVAPGAIDTLASRLETAGAVAAGPRLVDQGGRPEVSFGRMLSPATELTQLLRGRLARSEAAWARRRVDRLVADEREVDWVSGACLLVRRDAALAAGLFDERFFLYEEDVDFCAALRARGGRILFTPRATIVHHGGRSGAPRSGHYDRSHLAFYAKHAPRWTPWLRAWLRLRGRAGA
jgi:N-acetylglucosaminyl-diphospho-decaprenol L-rhamnosyltransferase